jgi:competence protein ComEA
MGQTGNKGDIDLNSADEKALTSIEGIDGARARHIMEARQNNGPFRSWEDVERVDGIGPTLLEKIKERARLGGDGAGKGAAGQKQGDGKAQAPQEEQEGDEELDADELVEALTSLAELDSEAVAAYTVAIESLEDEEMADKLTEFRGDHQRHVEELNELLERCGGEAVEDKDPEESLLAHLADTAAALGDRGVVLAMISNEQLTNGSYEAALELPCDDEVRSVIERNYADEQRHLRWLLERRAARGAESGADATR